MDLIEKISADVVPEAVEIDEEDWQESIPLVDMNNPLLQVLFGALIYVEDNEEIDGYAGLSQVRKAIDSQSKRMAARFSMGNDGMKKKVFVMAAWATEDEWRYAQMYPDFFGADDTSQTNNEKRDLFSIVVKDGYGQAQPVIKILMPNKKHFIYDVVLR